MGHANERGKKPIIKSMRGKTGKRSGTHPPTRKQPKRGMFVGVFLETVSALSARAVRVSVLAACELGSSAPGRGLGLGRSNAPTKCTRRSINIPPPPVQHVRFQKGSLTGQGRNAKPMIYPCTSRLKA